MSDAEQIRERLVRLRRVVATTRTPSGMTLLLPFDAEWLIEQAEELARLRDERTHATIDDLPTTLETP